MNQELRRVDRFSSDELDVKILAEGDDVITYRQLVKMLRDVALDILPQKSSLLEIQAERRRTVLFRIAEEIESGVLLFPKFESIDERIKKYG